MSKLIFCKFLDAEGNPRGKDYTYKSDIDVKVGDYVSVEAPRHSDADPQTKTVIVTKVDVSPSDIPGYERFQDVIKTIVGFAPVVTRDAEAEAPPNGEDTSKINMEDL